MNRRFPARIMAGHGAVRSDRVVPMPAVSQSPYSPDRSFSYWRAVDPIGRAIAQKLNEARGRPVLVDDKFGNPSLPYPASRG